MEYLESTMKSLVFDILLCSKWLDTNQNKSGDFNQTHTGNVIGEKMQFGMAEIKDTWNIYKNISYLNT